jgi:RimJ/RimL family protein N-acetyltransferase
MRHDIGCVGHRYSLRPVGIEDAEFIVDIRTDPRLSKYINATSPRVSDQVLWLERYFDRPGDWYFVIIDNRNGQREGIVGIYDFNETLRVAEWGRWVLRPGSLAAVESAALIYGTAFDRLNLDEIYCRTVADNKAVVSFHDSSGARRRRVLVEHVEISGQRYDSVEHVVDKIVWAEMRPRLDALALRAARLGRKESASC